MKAKTASRYAVFLILLVLGQEFCVARYVAQSPSRRIEKREAENESKEIEEKGLSRKKRNVATAVVVITLGVTAIGIGFEVYNKIQGCCGLYPSACTYRDEFKTINETKIQPISKEINALSLQVENRKEDIIQASYKLLEMWNEIKRIGEYQEEIVQRLAPSVVKAMDDKWKEIEDQLKAKNDTVQKWTYQEIETQFHSYFDSFETTILGLGGFMGGVWKSLSLATFRYYKRHLLNKMVTKLSTGTDYKNLVQEAKTKGITDVNAYIKKTAVTKVNSKFLGNKYSTFFNAINIVGLAVTVGIEMYKAIRTVKQCKKVRDDAKDARDSIQNAAVELEKVKTNVTEYHVYLNKEGWSFITDQITNSAFQNTLTDIQKLAQGAANQSQEMQTASVHIGTFLTNINSSINAPDTVQNLQVNLIKGLASVKFLLKCYLNKGQLLAYVSDHCKTGEKSLQEIFTDGEGYHPVSGTNCEDKGIPYATFNSLQPAIRSMAADQGYNADCVLNNVAKRKQACTLHWCDKKDASSIASEMGLTADQIDYFLQYCTNVERDLLTPAEQDQVCRFRQMWNASDDMIKQFLGECVKRSAINTHTCP